MQLDSSAISHQAPRRGVVLQMGLKVAGLLGSPSQTDQQGGVQKPCLKGPEEASGMSRSRMCWALGKQDWGLVGPDSGKGDDSDSGKDDLLSHVSSSKSKPPRWAGSRGMHVSDRAVCTLGEEKLRTGLVAQKAFFQRCGDNGTWWGCTGPGPWLSHLPGTGSGLWFTGEDSSPTGTGKGSGQPEGSRVWRGDLHPSRSRPHARPAGAGNGHQGEGWDVNHDGRPPGGACSWPDKSCQMAWALPSCYGESASPGKRIRRPQNVTLFGDRVLKEVIKRRAPT